MKYSLALLAALGLFQMAQAQTPRTPPTPAIIAQHEVQRYTTLLSLNQAQVDQATTFFNAEATSNGNARATERTAHQALEAAIKANDTTTIKSTAATLGQLNTERLTAHALAEAQFYAILDADQKAKFAELEKGHALFAGPGRPR